MEVISIANAFGLRRVVASWSHPWSGLDFVVKFAWLVLVEI